MKKILGLFLGILMVFVVIADALAETTIGGTIDVRGRWRENNDDLNNDSNYSTAFWEQKVNLWVDAKIAEGLKGYVELQSRGGDGFQVWGTNRGDNAPNQMLFENESFGPLQIRYAYMDFMIPGTPVGIKIGHFPVVLGHSIWADTSYWGSDGLMIYAMPTKEMMIALGTIKGLETASNTDRADVDMYGVHFNYTFMPKNTLGAHVNYLLQAGAAQDANNSANDTTEGDMKFWNFMVTADGSLDFGLGYKFEVDLQTGYIYDTSVAGVSDIKGSGLALLLGANYGIGEIAEVRFNAAYGSGDKYDTADKNEGYFSFNNYGYTVVYEDIVGQKVGSGTLGSGDFGVNNTMYLNIGAGVTPMKNMSVGLDLYYLRAAQENYSGQKKDLGIEVDLNFGYQIHKNLKWTFLAGYFMPGSHYDAIDAADSVKGDNAWAFEQVLSLSF